MEQDAVIRIQTRMVDMFPDGERYAVVRDISPAEVKAVEGEFNSPTYGSFDFYLAIQETKVNSFEAASHRMEIKHFGEAA